MSEPRKSGSDATGTLIANVTTHAEMLPIRDHFRPAYLQVRLWEEVSSKVGCSPCIRIGFVHTNCHSRTAITLKKKHQARQL
jgi:hypothetical protein